MSYADRDTLIFGQDNLLAFVGSDMEVLIDGYVSFSWNLQKLLAIPSC
jgi:hypothetical protein